MIHLYHKGTEPFLEDNASSPNKHGHLVRTFKLNLSVQLGCKMNVLHNFI